MEIRHVPFKVSYKLSTHVEGVGIVFIGPFPIGGFATNKQILYLMLTVSVILIIVFSY